MTRNPRLDAACWLERRACCAAWFVCLVLLVGCGGESGDAESGYIVECEQQLPVFTLGPQSNPTPQEEANLCTCVWEQLTMEWERDTASKLRAGKTAEVSSTHLRAFPPRLGGAIEVCGGMSL